MRPPTTRSSASRSPFSVWGPEPSLETLQGLARAVPIVLGLALLLLPKRRDPLQMAALGAALLVATEVDSEHWSYFFMIWWVPLVLVNLFGSTERISGDGVGSGDSRSSLSRGRRNAAL